MTAVYLQTIASALAFVWACTQVFDHWDTRKGWWSLFTAVTMAITAGYQFSQWPVWK